MNKTIFLIAISVICLSVISTSYPLVSLAVNTQTITTNPTSGNSQSITTSPSNSVSSLTNPLTKVKSVGDLVKSGLEIFSYIAVLIGVVMFVVVGLKYILAQGNVEKMKAASQWLMAIVIGVAIVIGARVAVTIIINTLSSSGVVSPKVIQSAQDAVKN